MDEPLAIETPLNDLVDRALEKMASGEWRLILEHPEPSQGTSACGFDVGKEIARRVATRHGGETRAIEAAARKWQDIETAPRDGTMVDLWMQSSFWDADGKKQVAVEMRIPDARWFDQQWTNMDGNPHDYLEGFTNVEFTHWVPTPEPPTSS